ncbi:3-deoxy-7-phosphoheptulonate synthase [Lentzea sp. NPDC055074]
MNNALLPTRPRVALQQPEWADPAQVGEIRAQLAARPALVRAADIADLRQLLGRVAEGAALVVQAGDCAENPAECSAADVARKTGLLDALAGTLQMIAGRPVLRAGRIAGQFVKPRSRPTEVVGGVELPVYRGHLVNSPEPTAAHRVPDPFRLLVGYRAANEVIRHLGWRDRSAPSAGSQIWTSHEALLLDYEIPLLRTEDERLVLASTHWPWIGERTRQLDGAHVELLASVANPVACKVGPGMTPDDLVALCERLDPDRDPGRLTLIVRMGAGVVEERLPALVAAVQSAGHPVVWLCDPMHGNTVTTPDGLKTRYVETMAREVRGFRRVLVAAGAHAGGLHLETTPDDVTECASDSSDVAGVGARYRSFCDPRLNPAQAVAVVSSWNS